MTRIAPRPRLFYDAGCGPCTFFARAFQGVSRTPFGIEPLNGFAADRALVGMDPTRRYDAFHFLLGTRAYTGADAVPPLVEAAFGPTAGRVARDAPPVAWALRRSYLWFWQYRRTRGCAAGSGV